MLGEMVYDEYLADWEGVIMANGCVQRIIAAQHAFDIQQEQKSSMLDIPSFRFAFALMAAVWVDECSIARLARK